MKVWCRWKVILLGLSIMSSCASHDLQDISDIKLEKDLVESFSLDDGRFEQYKNADAVAATPQATDKVAEQATKVPASTELKGSGANNLRQGARPAAKKAAKVASPPAATPKAAPSGALANRGSIISKKNNYYRIKQGKKPLYPADYPADYIGFDQKYHGLWHKYRPTGLVDEEAVLHISYLGLSAGHAIIKTLPLTKFGQVEAYHFMARLISAKYFEGIYKLDDIIETFLAKEEMLPIKYSLVQRESKQNVDDLQLFDHQENKTYYYYKRVKKDKVKEEQSSPYIPAYFQDSFSGLVFARGLPLKVGDYYEFPIVTRSRIWITKVWVDDEETVSVLDQEIPAVRVRAETHYPGVLEKKGDILFWFSNDDRHLLLKFAAKVKIGSVKGKLIKYTPGTMPLSAF